MAGSGKTTAIKFLGRQLRELAKSPLPGVVAGPVDEADLTLWHATLTFPDDHAHYPGMPLHFEIKFTDTYPSTGPDLRLLHSLLHSHVYDDRVCFSLLSDFRGFFEATNTPSSSFWNPTRTMRSFLEDFANFLIVDEDQHKDISDREGEAIMAEATRFTCSCGHKGEDAGSDLQTSTTASDSAQAPAAAAVESPTLSDVEYEKSVDALLAVCRAALLAARPEHPAAFLAENLASGTLCDQGDVDVSGVSEIPPEAAANLICSISGCAWDEEGVVMGFGVHVSPNGRRTRITTDLVPISREAFFEDGIRVSALGNSINGWLPFVINDRNWRDRGAREAASDAILRLARAAGIVPAEAAGRPVTDAQRRDAATFVLGELWKTKVVELMSEEEHASEKVLNGLFALDHIFLSLGMDDPGIIELATTSVTKFISNPNNRIKKHVPDFGRFQPLLLIADVQWLPSADGPGACSAFVDELFTRNALWIQKSHPDLADTSTPIPDRVERSWDSSATGLRLLCFQVGYLRNAKIWADATVKTAADGEAVVGLGARRSLRLSLFSKLGGRPDQQMAEAFQQETKAVQKISNQIDIFQALGGATDRAGLDARLVSAMKQSATLGYHGPRPTRSDRDDWRGGGEAQVGDGRGRGRGGRGRGGGGGRRGREGSRSGGGYGRGRR